MKSAFPGTHKASASAKSLQLAAELLRIQLIFPARFGGELVRASSQNRVDRTKSNLASHMALIGSPKIKLAF